MEGKKEKGQGMRYTLTHTHAHAHAHNAHAQVEMCPRLMLGSGWLWSGTTARACCGSLGSTTRRRVRGAELRWTSASAATTAPSPAIATSRARTGTACSAPHTRLRCWRCNTGCTLLIAQGLWLKCSSKQRVANAVVNTVSFCLPRLVLPSSPSVCSAFQL